jgi:ComEC/Rec2-related protein
MPSPLLRATSRFLRLHPALPLLAGLLAGILPTVPAASAECPGLRLILPGILVLLLAGLAIVARRNPLWQGDLAKAAVGVGVGALTTWLALFPGAKDLHRQLPPGPCGVELEVVVTDPTAVPNAPDWLGNPKLLQASLRRFRLSHDEPWREASGNLALRLPPEDSPRVGFGDGLTVRGTCTVPDPARFPRDFDLRDYLLSQGIRRIVHAQTGEFRSPPAGPFFRAGRLCLNLRDRLLTRLTAPLGDLKNRQILAALLFGCRQGLDARDRQSYQASGTIHIFAISGLHVGIVASILLLCLRGLPFRPRHLLVPLVLLGYVLSTGFQPAAVRALLMLSLWLIQRALLRPTSPLNAVFLAAVLILVFQPLACLGAGFQFSFTVAGFLVLAWRTGRAWPDLATGAGRWIPARLLTRPRLAAASFRRWLWGGTLACLVAWLASLGINVALNGYFVPTTPLSNFAMLPVLSALSIAVSAQILLLPLPWVAGWTGGVVGFLLDVARQIGENGGGARFWLPPHPAVLTLYYLALTVAVTSRQRRTFFPAATVLAGILLLWHFRDVTRPPAVLVLHGGSSQIPAVVLCPGGGRPPLIVNAPGGDSAYAMRNILVGEGVADVDALLLPSIRRDHAAGTEALLAAVDIHRLLLPETYRAGTYARRAVEIAATLPTRIAVMPTGRDTAPPMRYTETGLRFRADSGSDWQLSWRTAESTVDAACRDILPGWRQLAIRMPGRPEVRLDLPHQNRLRVIRVTLETPKKGKSR